MTVNVDEAYSLGTRYYAMAGAWDLPDISNRGNNLDNLIDTFVEIPALAIAIEISFTFVYKATGVDGTAGIATAISHTTTVATEGSNCDQQRTYAVEGDGYTLNDDYYKATVKLRCPVVTHSTPPQIMIGTSMTNADIEDMRVTGYWMA